MTAYSADEARRVLEARAVELARPLSDEAAPRATLELLEFTYSGSVYAVEAAAVAEVLRRPSFTPVPHTPPAVLGVVNHRGRVVALVDVSVVLGAPAPAQPTRLSHAVVVAAEDAVFALVADGLSAVRPVAEDELAPPDRLGDEHDPVVRGLTPELATIVDVATLARDPRIRVDDAAQ